MKYFTHSTSAMLDEKLYSIYIQFGYEGTGLFWAILEKIGLQESPINTAVLKKQLNVGKKLEKVWEKLEENGLISSLNGQTFNINLLKFAESSGKLRQKNLEKIKNFRKRSNDNQTDTANVTGYKNNCNENVTTPKENKIKENIKEEKNEVKKVISESDDSAVKIESNEKQVPVIPPTDEVLYDELFYIIEPEYKKLRDLTELADLTEKQKTSLNTLIKKMKKINKDTVVPRFLNFFEKYPKLNKYHRSLIINPINLNGKFDEVVAVCEHEQQSAQTQQQPKLQGITSGNNEQLKKQVDNEYIG